MDPLNDKMTLQLESQEFDENGNPKYPAITRDVNVTGILVADSSVGYETSYYCFMDIKDLRELYKEYKRVNKIRDDKNQNSGNTNTLENYSQVKVKVSDIDLVSQVDRQSRIGLRHLLAGIGARADAEADAAATAVFGQPGGISLLVAAIGITNTMIMSIYERTREIGVMKVLGCKIGNIRAVFLMEAGLIGFCGGLAGVGISIGISKLLNYLSMSGGLSGENGNFLTSLMGGMGSMTTGAELSIIPPWLMAAAIVFATIIGLVSGFYPRTGRLKFPRWSY